MTNKLKRSVAQMVASARERIKQVPAAELLNMFNQPEVQIVDIRDIRERQRDGYIPGSFHCPRGMAEFWVDPDSPYYKDIFAEDKTFIFYCASGWRSALTVDTLRKMGMENIAHLEHGFGSWKKVNGTIEFSAKK